METGVWGHEGRKTRTFRGINPQKIRMVMCDLHLKAWIGKHFSTPNGRAFCPGLSNSPANPAEKHVWESGVEFR